MLTISPIYASILISLVIFLAYRVTTFRQKEVVDIGVNGCSEAMMRAYRAHGNAIENIPLALILLVIMELNHLAPWLLHVFGLVLVLSRLAHAWGLSRDNGASKGRFYGTLFSWLCVLVMAIVNVLVVFIRS